MYTLHKSPSLTNLTSYDIYANKDIKDIKDRDRDRDNTTTQYTTALTTPLPTPSFYSTDLSKYTFPTITTPTLPTTTTTTNTFTSSTNPIFKYDSNILLSNAPQSDVITSAVNHSSPTFGSPYINANQSSSLFSFKDSL